MTEKKRIMILPGDGIGQEVMKQGVKLLENLQEPLGMEFELQAHEIAGEALRKYGIPLQEETLEKCKLADAVLVGAVGAPEFDHHSPNLRPERALLDLRAGLGLYCNWRPTIQYDVIHPLSSLKPERMNDINFVVVRELTGGLDFGKPADMEIKNGLRTAVNTMVYDEYEIKRIAKKAFELARYRRRQVTSVDKANVLEVSQLWRTVVDEVAGAYPDVTLNHMLVDNCAMQLITNPGQFDVILTENLFGDILSKEASMISGSVGMLPSASLGDGTPLYEPVHGSAPDIAGKNIANPIAMFNSIAMMLRYSFNRPIAACAIEDAIAIILNRGYHTSDINIAHGTIIGTEEFGQLTIEETLRSFAIPYMTV